MKIIKRFISILLSLSIILSIFCGIDLTAKADDVETDTEMSCTVSSTDDFGDMLSKELEETGEENNKENTVIDVVIENGIATVKYHSLYECTLVVAIYDENDTRLITSSSVVIDPDEDTDSLEIRETDIPEFFIVKVYLIDTETFAPLSNVYVSNLYTREIQELVHSNVNDYSEDLVLNLDNDSENNFAVYSSDVVIFDSNDSVNTLNIIDEEKKEYLIQNADETIKNIKVGDVISCKIDDVVYIIKAKTISIEENNVLIVGDESSIDEVFDYVKIDSSETSNEIEYDDSTADDAFSVEESSSSRSNFSASRSLIDVNKNKTFDQTLNISKTSSATVGNIDNVSSIKGSVGVNLSLEVICYIAITKIHIKLDFSYSLSIKASIEGYLELRIPMGVYGLKITDGCYFDCSPYFVFGGNLKTNLTGEVSGHIGFAYINGKCDSLSTIPNCKIEIKASGSVYIGVDFGPRLSILNRKASLTATIKGIASMSYNSVAETSADSKHTCKNCLKGEIIVEAKCELNFQLFEVKNQQGDISDKGTFKFTLLNWKNKFLDFYYSHDYKEFAFTTCPHYTYKTTINVVDDSGVPVNKVNISIDGKTYTSNDKGKVITYLPSGNHSVVASLSGVGNINKNISVQNAATTTTVSFNTKIANNQITQSGISNKVLTYNRHKYQVFDMNLSRKEAAAYCAGINGHLVTITNRTEDNKVYDYVTSTGYNQGEFWIGASDMASEGNWKWDTGEKFRYSHWASGQPDNAFGGKQHYAVVYLRPLSGVQLGHPWSINEREWDDIADADRRNGLGFVCEWDSVSAYNKYINTVYQTSAAFGTMNFSVDITEDALLDESSDDVVENSTNENQIKYESIIFEQLQPNIVYNLYAMKTREAQEPFGTDNLLYIEQKVSDENGNIVFDYSYENWEYPDVFAVAIENEDISNTTIHQENFVYDGEEHTVSPEIIWNDEVLTMGLDYYLTGEYAAVEPGEHTYFVKGCGNFFGSIEVRYCIHQWDEGTYIVEPECEKVGEKIYTCIYCKTTKSETVNELGHNFVFQSTTNATCENQGYDIYKCSRCNATENRNYVDATGHNYEVTSNTATCTEAGIKTSVCSKCGDSTTADSSALGHTYNKVYKAPTCVETGGYTNTCTRCGDVVYNIYEENGHDYGECIGEDYINKIYTAEGKFAESISSSLNYYGKTYYTTPYFGNSILKRIIVTYPQQIRIDINDKSTIENYNFYVAKYILVPSNNYLNYIFSYKQDTGRSPYQSAIPYTDKSGNLINMKYVDYKKGGVWNNGEYLIKDNNIVDVNGSVVSSDFSETRPHIVYSKEEALESGIMNVDGTVNVNSLGGNEISFSSGVDGIYTTIFNASTNSYVSALKCDDDVKLNAGVHNVQLCFYGSNSYTTGNLLLKIYDKDKIVKKTPATETTDEIITYTCMDCGEEHIETSSLDISNFKIKTVSLSLASSITMNFKVLKTAVADFENPYVQFTRNGNTVTVSDYTEQGDYLVFSYNDIAPQAMNDTVTAVLKAEHNSIRYSSKPLEYSVSKYAYTMLDKCSADQYAKLRTLLVDLLNYGAEAQNYQNYKTDDLVNSKLTDLQKAWASTDDLNLKDVTNKNYSTVDNPIAEWKSASLQLNDSVAVRYKFTAQSVDNLSVKVTCGISQWEYNNEKIINNGDGTYSFLFSDLNADKMSQDIFITIMNGDTAVSNTMRFSVESYSKKVQDLMPNTNLNKLTDAMMRYGKSAANYA